MNRLFFFDLENDRIEQEEEMDEYALTDSQRDQLLTQDGGEYRLGIPQKSEDFDEWIKERGQEEWYDQSAINGHNGSNYIQWRVEQRPHWNRGAPGFKYTGGTNE